MMVKGLKVQVKNAFTLIEVMVATILISLVGLSLIQMNQNSTELSYTMQKRLKYSDWILMPAFELELSKAKKDTSFDSIMKPFNIDKRELRKELNQKVTINTTLVERIDMSELEGGEDDDLDGLDTVRTSIEGFRLEVYQQYIKMEHDSYFVYRVIKP